MELLEMARQLGKEIQKQECYKKLTEARKANDENEELQNSIGEFNIIRMSMDKALSDENRDDEKIKELNEKLKTTYEKIMQTEAMVAYNNAKQELDTLVGKINTIINYSAGGENPDEIDVDGCSGSCSTCSGCH